MTEALPPRWYVRGPNEPHVYDRLVPILDAFPRQSFCQTCVMVHDDPVGTNWHIEGPEVDTMLCGMTIGLDEGEVRFRPAKNICPACGKAAGLEEESS